MRQVLVSAGLASMLSLAAGAAIFQVEIHGDIYYNGIRNGGPLDRTYVPAGSKAVISFQLDSNLYLNDPDGLPTRGYTINQGSFTATYGSVTVGIQNPFPAGQTPMFVLRNNDPAVDGFFLSTGTAYPFPVPTSEPGAFGQFGVYYTVGYEGNTLSSLNIADAVGFYDFTGLTSFGFATDDGGNDAMGIDFNHMVISAIPAPSTLAMVLPLTLVRRRRR
ncbi:MAG: hypothetical protein KF805_09825 [Phycisphaeraceae bacterium]|nr:hypothetical protein [Phycisphaeraceae bacterium]